MYLYILKFITDNIRMEVAIVKFWEEFNWKEAF